jgi:hypothetical protein
VTAIVLEGWTNIPAGGAMGGACTLFVGFFVGDDLGTRWSKRGVIVVKIAPKLGVG